MVNLLDLEIITDDIVLRPVTHDWTAAILRANHGNVRVFFIPFMNEGHVRRWINDSRLQMVAQKKVEMVVEKAGELVGMVTVGLVDKEPECGLWIVPEMQGHGYGKKALTALFAWVFANTPIRTVRYVADINNEQSVRLARSLGCREVGVTEKDGKQYRNFAYEKTEEKTIHFATTYVGR